MLIAMVVEEMNKSELMNPPEQIDEGAIAPFSLLIPVQLKGMFFSHKNDPAHIFKSYVHSLTEGVAPKNATGEIAAALVLGYMDQVRPRRTGLYTLEGEGRGITFHDPVTLYNRWSEVEKRVGEKKQRAMRNLLINRANPDRDFGLLKKYIAYCQSENPTDEVATS
jgi:hypothetical protein